jgi:hypothetical protein
LLLLLSLESHFKANKRVTTPLPPKPDPSAIPLPPPVPTGPSVYDRVIPESLAWTPALGTVMPLIQHLKDGFVAVKPPAWHRNEERVARGLYPIHNAATQLEGWERELVWMEILLLTGNPQSSFRHLARGWGRDKGFHMVLAQYICERHGDVQRKRRDQINPATITNRRRQSAAAAGIGRANGDGNNVDGIISANVWDDACYGDTAYNEALAADLLDFSLVPCSRSNSTDDNTVAAAAAAAANTGEREYSFEFPATAAHTSDQDDQICKPTIEQPPTTTMQGKENAVGRDLPDSLSEYALVNSLSDLQE